MSIDGVNAVLASCWPNLRHMIGSGLQASLEAPSAGSGTFQIADGFLSVTPGMDFPPGITRLIPWSPEGRDAAVSLAFPLEEAGWSFQITGYLTGQLVSTLEVHARPFQLNVNGLRLTVDLEAMSDAADPDRLVVQNLQPTLFLDMEIPGFFTLRAKIPPTWNQVDHTFQFLADIEVNVGYLGGSGTFRGQLVLDPFGTSSVKVDLPVFGMQKISFPLPDWIPATFKQIAAGELPLKWGEGAPPATLPPGLPPQNSHSLFHEAQQIGQDIASHAPYGAIFDVRYAFDSQNRTYSIDKFVGERDSAIWSGHYLAAEAFHVASAAELRAQAEQAGDAVTSALYQAEQDVASNNVQNALEGIEKLLLVSQLATGSDPAAPEGPPDPLFPFYLSNFTGLLCRAVLPQSDVDKTCPRMDGGDIGENPPPCYHGALSGFDLRHVYYTRGVTIDGQKWYGFGRDNDSSTRDSYLGVLWGLAATFKFTTDAGVRNRTKVLLTEMIGFLDANAWCILTPSGSLDSTATFHPSRLKDSFSYIFHMRLAFLRVGKSVNPGRFAAAYDTLAAQVQDAVWLLSWVDSFNPVDPDHYYKFNLNHAAFAALLFFEDDPALRTIYKDAFRLLRRAVRHHRNAYFDLIWVLAQDEADRAGAIARLMTPITALLQEWLSRRDAVCRKTAGPGPGPTSPVSSLATQGDPAPAFLPRLYNVPSGTQRLASKFSFFGAPSVVVATIPLPLQGRPGINMDFLWQRSPFFTGLILHGDRASFDTLGNGLIESPGVDYLLAYWMAVYLQALSAGPHLRAMDARESIVARTGALVTARFQFDFSALIAFFHHLQALQIIFTQINSNTKPFGRDFAGQSLYELIAKDSPDIPGNKRNLMAKASAVGIEIALTDLDNLNQAVLPFLGHVKSLDPISRLISLFKMAATEANPARTAEIRVISESDFQAVPIRSLFDTAKRQALRDLVLHSGLEQFGLPWGAFLDTEIHDVGTEIRSFLGMETNE